MRQYDVAVIGAGLLGCFAARNLKRYDLSVCLIEKNGDVSLGASRANTAVIYAGYDNRPGSLKAKLCVQANRNFDRLCTELDVPFSRCGSLMLSYDAGGDRTLEKKLRHGLENGVEGLEQVSPERAKELETEIGEDITSALYCSSTGTVNPWQLCIAAFENAVANGVEAFFDTEIVSIENQIALSAKGEPFLAKLFIDCTGLYAGRLSGSAYYSVPDAADYLVIDRNAAHIPHRVIFEQSGEKCRGITAVPTVEGSLLLGPTHRPEHVPYATDAEGLEEIAKAAKRILPRLEMDVIRTFAARRPNVEGPDNNSIHDFVIEEKENIISLIGIKTPGLTCADEIGKHVAKICARKLAAAENSAFNPVRKGIRPIRGLPFEQRNELIRQNPDYGEIICLCEEISKAEVLAAIAGGASTPEEVKRRCGTMMGACQGSRCLQKIARLLEESHDGV